MPAGQAPKQARSRYQLKRPRENKAVPYQAAGCTAWVSITDQNF